MSLTTPCQVVLLSLFILADSYLFALDLFDGRDHHRIPLGLPSPFELYPGMFDPTVLPMIHKDNIRDRPYFRPPFTSEITTSRVVPKEIRNKVTTEKPPTSPPPAKDEETEEDLSAQDPDVDREVFLMKNVKVPENKSSQEDDGKKEEPQANLLSIQEDTKQSQKWAETNGQDSSNGFLKSEQEKNITDDSDLTKHSEYFMIPATAVQPAVLNLVPNPNTVSAVAGNNNVGLRDDTFSPAVITIDNNVNSVPSNQQTSNINVPLSNNNGASNNVYTILTIPNNLNQNNVYLQPNNPQVYNLIPLNTAPTGNYQPSTMYAIINNQLVPININNQQPLNIVPINSQPNNIVSVNNQLNNFVPINNQGLNFIPVNNQPNTFVPVNSQGNNFVNLNNQPNTFDPVNNQGNNFVNSNNQPVNIVPVNNVPSNFVPINYSNQQNNNNIPISTVPNNIVTLNTQSNNYVPANLVPVSNVPSSNQPINNAIPLSIIPNDKTNTPNSYVPVSLTPIGTVTYTRDQDDDKSDQKDVEIKSERGDE